MVAVDIYKHTIFAYKNKLNVLKNQIEKNTEILEKYKSELENYQQAVSLCEHCLQEQTDAKKYIESLVTAVLAVTYGSEFSFKLEFTSNKDGKVSGLKPLILVNGRETLVNRNGDGIRNVISFILRLAFISLNPDLHQVMILDEPLTNVDLEIWGKLIKFLEHYQRDVDLQIICITHVDCQFPDTIKVIKRNNVSCVENN